MTEQVFKIPLANVPQRFAIELAGRSLIVISKWNSEMPAWCLDFLDGDTSELLIACLPIVSGCNLLEQFEHVGIPGQLICYTDGAELEPPMLENLGVESDLYYIVELADG